MKCCYKYILYITKTEKRKGKRSYLLTNKVVWQSTQDMNENESVMIQRETRWSVHLEIIVTQGHLREYDIQKKNKETHMYDIQTKIINTRRIFVWHWLKEKWDGSTQKNRQKAVTAIKKLG